jgi:hypothetical protein
MNIIQIYIIYTLKPKQIYYNYYKRNKSNIINFKYNYIS